MDKIQVKVLDAHNDPGGMMMFLAKLTQRGHISALWKTWRS